MLALQQQQQQQLKATRRVKSTAPWSVHSCLGRHGDSSGDPNMGPQSKNGRGRDLYSIAVSAVHSNGNNSFPLGCSILLHYRTKTQLHLNSERMETIAGGKMRKIHLRVEKVLKLLLKGKNK